MKKILYILLGMFIAFYGFAVVCILNPGISEALGRFLYSDVVSGSGQMLTNDIIPDERYPDVETPDIKMSEPWEPDFDLNVGNEDRNDRYPDAEGSESGDGQFPASAAGDNEGMEEGLVSDYIPPEQSQLVIPENVSGRNGYQQIQDEQEQLLSILCHAE